MTMDTAGFNLVVRKILLAADDPNMEDDRKMMEFFAWVGIAVQQMDKTQKKAIGQMLEVLADDA